jgi:hypothetical protein
MDWAHDKVASRGSAKAAVATPFAASGTVVAPAPASEAASPTSDRERFFSELGQTGDAFGGLNMLLTALAGALVAWAGFMQHQTLKQAREEAAAERESRKVQQFESLFFQLLELSAAITERIEGPIRRGKALATIPGQWSKQSTAPSRAQAVAQRRRVDPRLPQRARQTGLSRSSPSHRNENTCWSGSLIT